MSAATTHDIHGIGQGREHTRAGKAVALRRSWKARGEYGRGTG
jgi:hypothetical protein